jgi:hypothetical protein
MAKTYEENLYNSTKSLYAGVAGADSENTNNSIVSDPDTCGFWKTMLVQLGLETNSDLNNC